MMRESNLGFDDRQEKSSWLSFFAKTARVTGSRSPTQLRSSAVQLAGSKRLRDRLACPLSANSGHASIVKSEVADARCRFCSPSSSLPPRALPSRRKSTRLTRRFPARSIPSLYRRCKIRTRRRPRPRNCSRANRRRFPGRRARSAVISMVASPAQCRCRSLDLPGKSCGRRVTATGAMLNSFASSNGLPRTRKRLAGTVFWLATCRSRAAGRCSPTTPAINSASTSISGLRRCQTTCKAARSASSVGHRCGRARSARRRSGSVDPYAYRAHPHRREGSGGHPHLGERGDQEGALPRGRS